MSSHTIEFIARGLIVHQNHVLVCWNPEGQYGYLPGGHVEQDESAAAALAREMVEETGLKSRVGPLLLTHENRFRARKRAHHELNLVFAAEIVDKGFLKMCHVAQSQKTAIPSRRKGSKGQNPPPPVESQEAHLEFHWLSRAQFKAATIHPKPMADWAARLLAGGLESTSGLLAADAPTSEWLSTMGG